MSNEFEISNKNTTPNAVFLKSIKDKMKVTKIVCTRALKLNKGGDVYVGMSSEWETTQDDGLHGLEELDSSGSGFSMKEAKVAGYLLGLQVDLAAYDRALASGYMGKDQYDNHVKMIRSNYNSLIQRELSK
jgi:hypothetical protein